MLGNVQLKEAVIADWPLRVKGGSLGKLTIRVPHRAHHSPLTLHFRVFTLRRAMQTRTSCNIYAAPPCVVARRVGVPTARGRRCPGTRWGRRRRW
jgi:hypothetical protein